MPAQEDDVIDRLLAGGGPALVQVVFSQKTLMVVPLHRNEGGRGSMGEHKWVLQGRYVVGTDIYTGPG